MRFTDEFLEELRAKVPVSEVVGRRYTLRRQGAEFVAAEDKSITVNDKKRLWWDFGKGIGNGTEAGGDIFKFLTDVEGLSFVEAVKTAASIGNIQIPMGSDGRAAEQVNNSGRDPTNGTIRNNQSDGKGRSNNRKIGQTYDYTDAAGEIAYQVVRFVHEGGGKSFAQRRPAPDGRWIWGLDTHDDMGPLGFMSKGDKDWQRYDEDKYRDWKYDQRATFPDLPNLKHGLYRLPEVLEALAEERPVFITEGEKDTDTLWEWGVPATTNSGGAKHWGGQALEIFKGADIIVAIDNDEPGRARADIIGQSLKDIAKRIRILDPAKDWADAPKGADVTDWRDQKGGTVEQLYTITKTLPTWTPTAPASRFGRVAWRNQEQSTNTPYEWLIKGLIPARASVAAIGPMGSGKSFETFNLGMHIATGAEYRGMRTKQSLVIFSAPEGGAGVVDRMRAYRAEYQTPLDGVPFEALTRRFNLFASDADVEGLIAEIKQIASEHETPLGLVIIDTFSAATTGMDENSSKDVSTVRARLVRIETECRCTVLFVHHMNASGERQRGHSSITADVESVIKIEMLVRWENKQQIQVTDDNDRPIRRITNFKQREAATGQYWDFVLAAKEIRKDADGDRVTSCVSLLPARATPESPVADRKRNREGPKGRGYNLYREGEAEVFKAILAAIAKEPEPAPVGVSLPYGVRGATRWSEVGIQYKTKVPNDDGETDEGKRKYAEKIKKTLFRARKTMLDAELIGVDQIGGEHPYHVVWPTGRAVWGPALQWPAEQTATNEPKESDDTDFGDFLK